MGMQLSLTEDGYELIGIDHHCKSSKRGRHRFVMRNISPVMNGKDGDFVWVCRYCGIMNDKKHLIERYWR